MTKQGKGILRHSGQPYKIKPLSINDLTIIKALQADVFEIVENKASLQMLTDEEFKYILNGKGYMVGTFVNEELIAFRAMLYPPVDDPEHLGRDAGLKESDYDKVIYSEISIVHPNYRGNQLQTIMGKLVMDLIDHEKFHYVAATVAPGNIPSMKDKFRLGMYIVSLTEKYEGKARYVYFKKLVHEATFTSDFKSILADDYQAQQSLLAENYLAVDLVKADNLFYLIFKKEV